MPSPATASRRCDANGRAFAGSQRQIQFYVNEEPLVLQRAVSEVLKMNLSLRWVSPLRAHKYREYRDADFLNALGLSRHHQELRRFWPNKGPVWDALAIEVNSGGVLLLEAKSHVPEIRGSGCQAMAERSIVRIDASIARTKAWLGAPGEADWKGELYQSANRIAHLFFFREVLNIPAWLVNVYFTDDPHSPTTRAAWETATGEVKKTLGFSTVPYYSEVFLPASGSISQAT
jgi:hypothetical protein